MKNALFFYRIQQYFRFRPIKLGFIFKWFTDSINLKSQNLEILGGYLVTIKKQLPVPRLPNFDGLANVAFNFRKLFFERYLIRKPLFLFFLLFSFISISKAQNLRPLSLKNNIAPGIHIQYSGRYGLIDIMYQRTIFSATRTSLALQVGGGFLNTLDIYNRSTIVAQGGIGIISNLKENRELEIVGIVSSSDEFWLAPSLFGSYNLISKNKKYKIQLLIEGNIEDFKYIRKQNPFVQRENIPIKIYLGIGVKIARCF